MLDIREEELNKVNGGMGIAQIESLVGLYRPKFAIGERVMSKNSPEFGVGFVTDISFHDGYYYTVMMINGGKLYAPDDELEFAVTQ